MNTEMNNNVGLVNPSKTLITEIQNYNKNREKTTYFKYEGMYNNNINDSNCILFQENGFNMNLSIEEILENGAANTYHEWLSRLGETSCVVEPNANNEDNNEYDYIIDSGKMYCVKSNKKRNSDPDFIPKKPILKRTVYSNHETIDFLNISKENIAKYPEDFTWPTIPDENQCIIDILIDDFTYDTDPANVNRQRNNQNDCSNLSCYYLDPNIFVSQLAVPDSNRSNNNKHVWERETNQPEIEWLNTTHDWENTTRDWEKISQNSNHFEQTIKPTIVIEENEFFADLKDCFETTEKLYDLDDPELEYLNYCNTHFEEETLPQVSEDGPIAPPKPMHRLSGETDIDLYLQRIQSNRSKQNS